MNLLINPPQENPNWGYTLYLKNGEPDLHAENFVIHCGGKAGVINDHNAPISVALLNGTFLQGPVTTAWMMKLFEVEGYLASCNFIGAGQWKEETGPRDGHPVYFSPVGDVGFVRCNFIDNAGNLQFVQRDYGYPHSKTGLPVVDKAPDAPSELAFHDCTLQNNSWNAAGGGGGGAAQIAAYNATEFGTKVVINNSVITNTIPYVGKEHGKTNPAARGAVTLWNECWEALVAGTNKIGDTEPNADKHFSALEIDRLQLRYTQADRSLIDVKGTKEISIQGMNFQAIGEPTDEWPYVVDIDKNPSNPTRAERIEIEPMAHSSQGFIRHTLPSGERIVTPISEGYSWSV